MIEKLLDANERIIWSGMPDRKAYIFNIGPFFFFGIFWGIFDLGFISAFFSASSSAAEPVGGGSVFFFAPFFLLHMTPCWIALFSPIYRAFNHKYMRYVVTDRRIYIQSGVIGRDISTYEFTNITDVTVNVGFIEKLNSCGSVILHGGMVQQGNSQKALKSTFKAIKDPYGVYKLIKELTLDVKTDIYYPNAMRPGVNPGYNTELRNDTVYTPVDDNGDDKRL